MLPPKIDEMLKNNMTAKGYEMVINIDTRLNPQWDRAASSTGKYHRTSDGTSQTIAEHTGEMLNAAIKIMKCLRLTKNTGDCDSFLMSIVLHDVRKYTYVEQRHTNKRHDTEMANIIHFNKDKPENHNIYKPNFKDKYVKYCDNNIWKIGDLMKIVTELYLSKMDLAEEKFEELKQFLEESKKDRFQHLLDNREEPDVMGGILKRIIEIIYNERTVITERIK